MTSVAGAAAAPASTLTWLMSLVTPTTPTNTTNTTASNNSVNSSSATSTTWTVFGTSRLCKACKANDIATVKALATRENVNIAGWLGWAPVHKAAQGGAVDCMLLLLQLGADVNARDLEGQTAMHFAAAAGHVPMVRCLLSPIASAAPDVRDEQQYSPLHLAALNGHTAVVQMLIDTAAVDVNASTVEGLTPLHAALGGGFARCAELLIDAGARGAALDGAGRTPFAVAKTADSLARGVVAYQARKERAGKRAPVDIAGAVGADSAGVKGSNSKSTAAAPSDDVGGFRLRDGGFVTNRLDELMVVTDAPSELEDAHHNDVHASTARHDTFEYQGQNPAVDDDDDDDDDDDAGDDGGKARAMPPPSAMPAEPRSSRPTPHVDRHMMTPLLPKRRPNTAATAAGGGDDVVSVSIDTVQPGAEVPSTTDEKHVEGDTGDAEREVCSEEVAESDDEEPRGLSSTTRESRPSMALTLSDDDDDEDDDDDDNGAGVLKPAKLKGRK